jgi:hypothetical protein
MFAKRRANVRNLGFCTFYKLFARARKVLLNPDLRKHFSVSRNATTDTVTNFKIQTLAKSDDW